MQRLIQLSCLPCAIRSFSFLGLCFTSGPVVQEGFLQASSYKGRVKVILIRIMKFKVPNIQMYRNQTKCMHSRSATSTALELCRLVCSLGTQCEALKVWWLNISENNLVFDD
jgi:hypothetical protein